MTRTSRICPYLELSISRQPQIRAEYRNLNPEDIKVIDPCMGSGHILVYCFDVLMQIYESQGYTQRDAAQSILENNLFGLDIDKRAAQLAYFAVMMKARQYDRRISSRGIKPHVYAIEESNGINRGQLKYFGTRLSPAESSKAKREITALVDNFVDAKEFGSILNVAKYDWDLLDRYVTDLDDSGQMSLDSIGIDETQKLLHVLVEQGQVMAQKYEVVVTNPPYMAISSADVKLAKYVKDNYEDEKVDLYSVFINKCGKMLCKNGFQAMITQHGWMFLGSFEKMRIKKLAHDLINMAHLGPRAFEEIGGEVVQTSTFIFRNSSISDYKGVYSRLIEPSSQDAKEELFLTHSNEYIANKRSFANIPGHPIAYWICQNIFDAFQNEKPLSHYAEPKVGFQTGNNDKYLRFWQEVSLDKIGFGMKNREVACASGQKWFPCNKGGSFRRWYGNFEYVANWENDGLEMRNEPGSYIRNSQYYFRSGLTWSTLSSTLAMRYSPLGTMFETKGSVCFPINEKNQWYLLALLNSCVVSYVMSALSPTLDFHEGPLGKTPVIFDNARFGEISDLATSCVEICEKEWNTTEGSWDFLAHPLVLAAEVPDFDGGHKAPLSDSYAKWEVLCEKRFNQLKANEEELNCIFIDIYGLQDELTPDVEDKDVTVRKADLGRDIRSLLSYAVGCMFGRYSLDEPGLIYAGGKWDSSKYSTFIPDKDNCIPITDEAYFEDDIVGQFVGWMKKAFGEEKLEANLDFIAKALGNKGATSREVIRNYFLNDFMKDHIKIYQKRPIYWLFDSGKQNGFKALVYMHRWNADTVGNLRVEYLHKMQHTYEREIIRMQETIDNSRDSREVSRRPSVRINSRSS
ncbi:MAG: BREX-1 system adenine-specific DNA-methyltransferase PglX [Frisingicoccus sp.]